MTGGPGSQGHQGPADPPPRPLSQWLVLRGSSSWCLLPQLAPQAARFSPWMCLVGFGFCFARRSVRFYQGLRETEALLHHRFTSSPSCLHAHFLNECGNICPERQRVDDRWQWADRQETSSAPQQGMTRVGVWAFPGPCLPPQRPREESCQQGLRSAPSPGRALLKRTWLRGGVRPNSGSSCLLSPGPRPGAAPLHCEDTL